MTGTRKQLDARALMLMVLLTALQGFQQVAIRLAAAEVSLLMQVGIVLVNLRHR